MFRNAGAALAGVVTAFVLVMLVEKTGHLIYPPPANLDHTDVEAMETYTATLPFLALLFPMIAWVIGTFTGSLIASKIGTANPLVFAGVVGGMVLAATIANLIFIPHPHWFSIVSLIAIAATAWFAAKVASGRARGAPTPEG
ncbi:MAG: hypothetical protein P8X81_12745 [Woeseiaceae bacterium]|jgi:hypothetical protein